MDLDLFRYHNIFREHLFAWCKNPCWSICACRDEKEEQYFDLPEEEDAILSRMGSLVLTPQRGEDEQSGTTSSIRSTTFRTEDERGAGQVVGNDLSPTGDMERQITASTSASGEDMMERQIFISITAMRARYKSS